MISASDTPRSAAARLTAAFRSSGRYSVVFYLQALHEGRLTPYTAAKIERDAEQILDAQRRIAASKAKIAYGTDCGMFPFSHGNLEFQAMVKAGLDPARVLRAATGTVAELLGRSDIGVLAPGAFADIVAMPGYPITDIATTTTVDFVMIAGLLKRQPQPGL